VPHLARYQALNAILSVNLIGLSIGALRPFSAPVLSHSL
jgi:hypothetical protein